MNVRTLLAATLLLAASRTPAAELSVVALQADLRAAAGNPGLSVVPTSLTYNPLSGKLLICGGGSNPTILEWEMAATNGTVLVPSTNWGGSPYAAAYIPSRGSYMVTDGSNDKIIEVQPGAAGQTPTTFLTMVPPTFPAGGMVQDGNYAYYKNQWSGIQQTVNRFTLTGTNGVESEYVPYSAFTAWNSTGPSQQLAMDSAKRLHLSARVTSDDAARGIYRWDPDAAALVPVLTHAQIVAYTGQAHITIYGMTFDGYDNLYFYDIYSGDILRYDRLGRLSTFITNDEIRDFMGDPAMQVHPSYMIAVGDRLVFISGNVSGHVLAARIPPEVEMATVPGSDYEVNGPTYTYEIGKYEITNAEYCAFLNDAQVVMQTNPADPRCSNMWVEPVSGDVYMMDVTPLPGGTEWYDRTLYKTSDIPDSKIKYAAGNAIGSRFYVLDGFTHHPVGTVSWFGAAKFCNWLTVVSGLPASEVCYHEGSSKYDWYPITAADWTASGISESERLDLVRNYRGYRLPMDGVNVDNGGPGVSTSWNMDANPYNEWYKAAAFDPAAPDTVRLGLGPSELVQPDHWLFGFGADTITEADANLGGINDPYLETTPVGWYDGVNTLTGGTPTNDTGNRYGLYDMCGNVSEWIGDTALESPWSSTYRGARGGRFSTSDPQYATNSVRIILTARYYAENNLGFRVARSFGYGDFNGDGAIDALDYDFFAAALAGPAGAAPTGFGYEACDYDGDSRVDLRDFAAFTRRYAP